MLLTGSSGFTGQHLSRSLAENGFSVIGVGSQSQTCEDYHHVDIMDKKSLTDVVQYVEPTHVIHLAGISFVGHADSDAFYNVNVIGTRNLLSSLASLSKLPKRVVLASSANIYGQNKKLVLGEATPANPMNDYAVSKYAMELMATLWSEHLPIIITRPFNYTGVGQSLQFVVPKIVDHFKRRADKIRLGNIHVARDFSDVRFVADVYVKILQSTRAMPKCLNICSGKLTSIEQILTVCSEISGYKIEVCSSSSLSRGKEIKALVGDTKLLRRTIPGLHELSFRDTVAWMMDN